MMPTRAQRALFRLSPWLVLAFSLDAAPGFDRWLAWGPVSSFFTGFLPGVGIAGLWMAGLAAMETGFLGWVRAFAMGVSLSEGVRLVNGLFLTGDPDRAPRTWGGFAIFLILSAGLALLFRRLAFHRAEAERQRALAEDARQQSLRAKLAPHFIFNTLNTLKALIPKAPDQAEAMTDRLAVLFRQIVARADAPAIPLREELAFVEAYLGIERARLGGRLQVRVDLAEELEACEVPPLSLQVLVENAVKHGVAPLERGGEIRIAARREGRDLRIDVSDPGPGLGAPGGTGTALETLRQRLAQPGDLVLARVDGRTVASLRWRRA